MKKTLFFPIFSDVTCHNSAIIRPVSIKFRHNYLLKAISLTQKAYPLSALAASNDKKHIFTPPTKSTHEGNFFLVC